MYDNKSLNISGENCSSKGKFIVFEGIDGSGKSTQIKLLAEYLNKKGIKTKSTLEPTERPVGALIRQCLTKQLNFDEITLAYLFAADRIDHIFNPVDGLLRDLNQGYTILCDRYYFSSYAYHGCKIKMQEIININELARKSLKPDLIIYLDLLPEESFDRLSERDNLQRYEDIETMKEVYENYKTAFDVFRDLENIVIVKSQKDYLNTVTSIIKEVDKLFDCF